MKKLLSLILSALMLSASSVSAVWEFTGYPVPEAKSEIYVIENMGTLMGEYSELYFESYFDFNKMQASNGAYVSLENIDGTNYVPFRYLLEEIAGFSDVTDISNSSNSPEALFEKMKELKSPSFIWENIDGIIHLYITDGENYYYGKVNDAFKDKNHDDVTIANGTPCDIKNINGSCYIPLRALELFGLQVEYYPDTELIIITKDKYADTEKVNDEYKKLFNDNYYSYSNYYGEGNTVKNAYCVNQYGKYLFYVDSETFKIYSAEAENPESAKELKIVDYFYEELDFTVDMITFEGNKLYGVRTNNAGDFNGTLFAIYLSTDNEGNFIGRYYREYGDNLTNIRKILYRTNQVEGKGFNYFYFVDDSDGKRVKRMDVYAFNTVENITDRSVSVSAFNVSNDFILYTDESNTMHCSKINNFLNRDKATLEFNGLQEYEIKNLPPETIMRNSVAEPSFNGTNGTAFYCVLEAGDSKGIYSINLENDTFICKEIVTGDKDLEIKNITVLDGVLYANVNGEYIRVNF